MKNHQKHFPPIMHAYNMIPKLKQFWGSQMSPKTET